MFVSSVSFGDSLQSHVSRLYVNVSRGYWVWENVILEQKIPFIKIVKILKFSPLNKMHFREDSVKALRTR